MTARILITGSRTLRESDYATVRDAIAKAAADLQPPVVVVHGNALGADRLADRASRALGLKVEPHSARWRTEGRAAGPLRNQRMVDLGADICIAFIAVGRENVGTKDCWRRADRAGIPVRVYEIGASA